MLYGGALDATRKTLASEGLRGLYKGMAAPLATVALFNAVMFATRGRMEQLLEHADGMCLAYNTASRLCLLADLVCFKLKV